MCFFVNPYNKTITDNTLDGQCTVPVDRELCNVSTYQGIVGCTPTNVPLWEIYGL